ncbi:hypothetical protein HDA32_000497 [Spinactinospora alkalitolerans]|uniref:Uncharacterized protein n=1 Tax=Spinactinospora alkalitolerans TaxID=687207 RepID=A0A852TQ23_9ACTN|nr:hypothetical protein [Spinactinospora alkalitolerans]
MGSRHLVHRTSTVFLGLLPTAALIPVSSGTAAAGSVETMGGSGPYDAEYETTLDDWDRLPSDLPAFTGNLDVGYYGTFGEPNGGEYGRVGTAWLKWRLKGDEDAGREFVGSDCGLCSTDWDVRQKNLT